jgi:formylglycine-generating enzyme required for sulfatase activity
MQASRIFISYRRDDSELAASRLAEDLRRHFAPAQVFQDFASIDPGADFVDAVQRGLDTCAAVLVVIGSKWLNVVDRKGQRRLDVPGDWVRHEVAESLRRPGVRVFPVLLDHADMPGLDDLPEDLQALTRRQAFPLTVRHWGKDVAELVEHLRRVPGLDSRSEVRPSPDETIQREAGVPSAAVSNEEERKTPAATREPAPEAQPTPHRSLTGSVPRTALGRQDEGPRDEPRQRASGTSEVKTAGGPAVSWNPIAAIGAAVAIALVVFVRYAGQESQPAGHVFRDCDQCPEMVVVPAGSFMMGSHETEAGRSSAEGPQHRVTLAQPFAVGKYELTFDEWDACVAAGGCQQKPDDEGWGRGRQPVINVSWDDAQAYVSWLAKKTGKGYRLLSESEWEYAARAGSTTAYPWGQEPGTNRANFSNSGSEWSGKQTAPVGLFKPNDFGLYDMIGNVEEWTQDCCSESHFGAPADGSPWIKGDCGQRAVRGGSWYSTPVDARAAGRNGDGPGGRSRYLGFRLARTL